MDRIEVKGGMIAKRPNERQRIYYVTLHQDGAELPLWEGHSYAQARKEGLRQKEEFQLPMIDTTGLYSSNESPVKIEVFEGGCWVPKSIH